MKIELIGEEIEMIPVLITTDAGVRFVIEDGGAEKIARLIGISTAEHIDFVFNKSKFLGAGKVKRGGDEITFDSSSCMKELERDRPADPMVAQELIDELRAAVQTMLLRNPDDV